MEFLSRKNTTSPRFFDIGNNYHPNIQKNPNAGVVLTYMKKDTTAPFFTKGTAPIYDRTQTRLEKFNFLMQPQGLKRAVDEGKVDLSKIPLLRNAISCYSEMSLAESFKTKPDLQREVEEKWANGLDLDLYFIPPDEKSRDKRRVHQWIQGPPGCGKTVLSQRLLKEYRAITDNYT